MAKNLTNSQLDRQNVLNNRYTLAKVEEHFNFGGIFFAVNKFHAFSDGNKGSSVALGCYFLELNRYDYAV